MKAAYFFDNIITALIFVGSTTEGRERLKTVSIHSIPSPKELSVYVYRSDEKILFKSWRCDKD
jgi:hypothetical protein